MFRDGRTAEAIDRKLANGTLKLVAGEYEHAAQAVIDLWVERRAANADRRDYSLSISAPTNHDAHVLSAALREQRRKLGEIGPDQLTIKAAITSGPAAETYDIPLAVGDRVRLFKRTNATYPETGTVGAIGRNGTVLTVADIVEAGLVLRTAAGREGLVAWSSLKDDRDGRMRLAYGDVLTTNTSQGSTVTEHIFAMPAGSKHVTAFGAYTSGSRHREQSFIVGSEGAERGEVASRRPLGDGRWITPTDVVQNLARNLARQPEKDSALAVVENAENLRRGNVGRLQLTKHAAQRANGQNEPGLNLTQAFDRSRAERALAGAIAAVRATAGRRLRLLAGLARSVAALTRRVQAMVAKQQSEAREAPQQGQAKRRGRRL
jgi:hypothetical protein